MAFTITRQQLLIDLYKAYSNAIKHKRHKNYVVRFQERLEGNLEALRDEIFERRWKPSPSFCFIINRPKKREVFAADFRDRIVHHLYYNYVHEMFEKTFIADSYSCIKGRGTHYGIHCLEGHIRKESRNYKRGCYVLKMDIKGYFMHIERKKLLRIVLSEFDRMSSRRIRKGSEVRYNGVLDFEMLSYLSERIIMSDPTKGCNFISGMPDWEGLPKSKSLFHVEDGFGLPIGNLTSQLFSNVFLNVLDQYAKRVLGCKHYGRYVDDFYVVSSDRKWLHTLIHKFEDFLGSELSLSLSKGKTQIYHTKYGVPFLGAFVKHYRTYIENGTLSRMRKSFRQRVRENGKTLDRSINSYIGILKHWKAYGIMERMLLSAKGLLDIGEVTPWCGKFSYL